MPQTLLVVDRHIHNTWFHPEEVLESIRAQYPRRIWQAWLGIVHHFTELSHRWEGLAGYIPNCVSQELSGMVGEPRMKVLKDNT